MAAEAAVARPHAVLIDRDVLIAGAAAAPGVAEALELLRREQVAVAVLCDGNADGAVERLLGQVGPVVCCPHRDAERCLCRRPAPGLLLQAAAMLSVAAADCAVLGSSTRDAEAAASIGAACAVVGAGESVDAAVERLLPPQPAAGAATASEPSPQPATLAEPGAGLPPQDVVPLVLMGARRLPASAPWSAGIIG